MGKMPYILSKIKSSDNRTFLKIYFRNVFFKLFSFKNHGFRIDSFKRLGF